MGPNVKMALANNRCENATRIVFHITEEWQLMGLEIHDWRGYSPSISLDLIESRIRPRPSGSVPSA